MLTPVDESTERAALERRERELEQALVDKGLAGLATAKRKALKAIIADADNPKALRKAAKRELARRDVPVDDVPTRPAEPAVEPAEPELEDLTLFGESLTIDPLDVPKAPPVEAIETERGTVYAAGEPGENEPSGAPTEGDAPPEPDFAKPSDAPKVDFDVNGLGQYKVKRPVDGKLVGYTRVTTYIDNLESKAQLETWKLRLLLEGVAITETPDVETEIVPEPVSAKVRELVHVRDTAVAKARKADRKGKLEQGQLGVMVDGAWGDYKRAVDALARTLLDVGGVHEKADKGTDLHALFEVFDRDGMGAVQALLEDGKITASDMADVEAYAKAIEAAGIAFIPECTERPIVIHDLKVAGRMDRAAFVRLPGAQRATRVVADIKTGRVDYAAGKIAQQLEMYSRGAGYDLDTHETTDLRLNKSKALLIHAPAGMATCKIYIVDLAIGRKGNALSGQVRAWRNEGKKAIDFTVDLAANGT